MAYPSQSQEWENFAFNLSPEFCDVPDGQNQALATNMSANMYTNMASVENSHLGTAPLTEQRPLPSDPLVRWHSVNQKRGGPYFAGRDQTGSSPFQVDNFFDEQQYRNRALSDGASSVAAGHDAIGMTGSQPFTAGSTEEPSEFNRELPIVEQAMKKLKTLKKTSRAGSSHLGVAPRAGPKAIRKQSTTEDSAGMTFLCLIPDCGEVFKIQSDLKKHLRWHERPFKCDVLGCDKVLRGFTSINDLDRHKVTKHGIITSTTKAWCCSVQGCRSGQKTWFRLDNFRQHIIRSHSDDAEDIKEIVEDSIVKLTPNVQGLPQTVDIQIQESMLSDEDGPSNLPFVDYSPLPEYSAIPLGEAFTGAKANNNWPNFIPESPFDDYSGHDGSQSSLRTFSDVDASALNQSSYGNPQQSSPSSFTPGSSLSGPAAFRARSISSGQPPWAHSETTSLSVSQGQHQFPRKRQARQFPPAQTPKIVVVHQGDPNSSVQNQETPDLKAQAEAILQQGLPEDQLHESLANLLQKRSVRQPSPELRGNTHRNTSREVSASRERGRPTVTSWGSPYISYGNGSKNERAVSQASDRSQSTNNRGRTPHQNNNPHIRQYACNEPDCDKTFSRQSALDKHITRHRKPYGCTFDECPCTKTFGSKNDWKRHENSQHMQQNLWRCELCLKAFEVKKDFETHLQERHRVTDVKLISRICKERRIGANHSGSFWCGFCRKILPLDPNLKGVAAWDERFNHIADHFVPPKDHPERQRSIETWLPPDGDKTKGEREGPEDNASQDANTPYTDALEEEEEAIEEGSQYSSNQFENTPSSFSADTNLSAAGPAAQIVRRSSSKRKRRDGPSARARKDFKVTCCRCAADFLYNNLHWTCEECHHIVKGCQTCLFEASEPLVEEDSP